MNRYVRDGIHAAGNPLPASFEVFEAEALATGCGEALVREWPADVVVKTHTHPFDAEAVVVRGEMWLTVAERTWHLGVGGTFRILAGTPHDERYGPQGATFWVGRRQANA